MPLRPATVIGDPVIAGDRALLYGIADRPGVHASFTDVPWRIEWVDLTKVLSVQKMITTDGLDLRVAEASDDPAALVDLCLPAGQLVPPQGGFRDQDGHGFALSSLDPNLRVAGSHVAEVLVAPSPEVPPQKIQAFTFFISMGASYVQVARYQGQSFLREGYHRAACLLRVGVTRIPVVVIDAPSYQYIASRAGWPGLRAIGGHAPVRGGASDVAVGRPVPAVLPPR